jgi:hypothetical protein
MTLINCTVTNNATGIGETGVQFGDRYLNGAPGGLGGAGGDGAGLYNVGNMSLAFCTIGNNTCGNGGGGGPGIGFDGSGGTPGSGGSGGGIYSANILDLNTCTISGNQCGDGGDGGVGYSGGGANGAPGGGGGGICNEGFLHVTSCTIANNQTGAGGNGGNSQYAAFAATGGQDGNGGGILNDAGGTNAVVCNSLIAANMLNVDGLGGTNFDDAGGFVGGTGVVGFGFDLARDFTSYGFNLVSVCDGTVGFTNGVAGDQVGTSASPIDPLLGPLQMNGGITPTQALLPGSPAINKGKCFGIHEDQRADYRPYEYPGIANAIGGDGTDIGAFELGAP